MAHRPLIFSTHSLHPQVIGRLEDIGELRIASAPTPEAIDKESAGAEYIVVRANIAPQIVEREKSLRAMVRHGAGLDMIPVETCTNSGVLVANVPGANSLTVAEHAIWSALALLRKYPLVNRDLHGADWETARAHANSGFELSGRNIGIVGMGNVGREVNRIASQGFGMNVFTTTRSPQIAPDNVITMELDALLEQSDVIVLCCPLNDKTRGMIGRSQLARIKTEAVLINVSRGPVVDQNALVEFLASDRIRGAALDVFDEHPLPHDHPLMKVGNVILTPHMAGITTGSMLRMGEGVVDEITRIAAGKLPQNFINPEALTLYRRRFSK